MNIVKKTFGLAFRYAPFFTIGIFLLGFLQSMGSGIIVLQTQRVFDIIGSAITNKNNVDPALCSLIILFVIMMILHLLNGLQNYLYDVYIMFTRNKFSQIMSDKSSRINAEAYEKAAFLDLLNKAKIGMENSVELILVFGDIFTYYLPYFIFMMIYLVNIQTSFILFLLLIFLPVLLSQIIRIKLFSNLEHQSANYRRQLSYFDSCICDKEYIKETRSLNATTFFIGKLKELLKNINTIETSVNKKMSLVEMLLDFMTLAGYLCILMMLIICLKNGDISLGAFAAIYSSLSRIFQMMEEILRYHIGQLSENIGSIQNFISFLEYEERTDSKKEQRLTSLKLHHVDYQYPETEREVLKDINLELHANQSIAVVGKNGSGKTTLSKILLGLYTPTRGELILNGEVCENKANLQTACLFQNFQRYKLNLLENIKISDLDSTASVDNLLSYFNLNQLDPKIVLSPDFGGADLSIGQWQRVSMARAFYKKADFIVLDEPTASIDPIEENSFYEKFHDLSSDKTSIVIIHHLVSAKYADLILVMENGQITERGTHEELMKQKGIYYTMFTTQKDSYE